MIALLCALSLSAVQKEPAPKGQDERHALESRLKELHAALKDTDNDEKHAAIKAEIGKIEAHLLKGGKKGDPDSRLKDLHAALEKTDDPDKRAAIMAEIEKIRAGAKKGGPQEEKKQPDLEARLDQLRSALKQTDDQEKRAAIMAEIEKIAGQLSKGGKESAPEGKKPFDGRKIEGKTGDQESRLDELRAALKQTDDEKKRAAIVAEIEKIQGGTKKTGPKEGERKFDVEARLKDLHAALEKTEDFDKRVTIKEEIAKLEGAPSKRGGDPSEARVNHLLAQLKGAEGREREEIKRKLREAVGEFFDGRIQRRQKELAELQARMAEIQETIRAQIANREALIEQRVAELTGEKKGLQFPD